MKPIFKKLFTFSAVTFFTLFLLGAIGLLAAYAYLTPRLPEIDTLRDVKLQVPLRVFSKDGDLIAEFGEMKRIPLKYEQFPDYLIKAVLAAEDDRFFEHPGVDYQGILRAVYHLIRTGEKGQGGSTITMQVARNFFLSREKTFLRKFNEIFLALKIEKELSKEEILTLYLNKIYLGKRAYGFAAAAKVYYGRDLAELTLPELAMIAGLPKAPSRYNPVVNPERAVIRRNYVLGRMYELNYIDREQYEAALKDDVHAVVHGLALDLKAPYVAEMVRNKMVRRYGEKSYTDGFQVYTTIDGHAQRGANSALSNALLAYDRRHGYRGIEGHVEVDTSEDDFDSWDAALADYSASDGFTPALVIALEDQAAWAYTRDKRLVYLPWEQLSWARKYIDDNHIGPELKKAADILAVGDIIYTAPATLGCSWLAKKPTVAGAIVSLNPDDGAINSLVGGFDFYASKFNRVIQAKRQPGSSFKPFIYTAALDKGFSPAAIINDAPVVFDAPGLEDTWRPENYSGHFYGPTRLRQALIKSRNLVSIRLLRDIGIGYAVRYVTRFGFHKDDLPRDLSLALGSGALTPMELARGYAVFANGGYRPEPYLIDHILDSKGRVVMLAQPRHVCASCSDALENEKKAKREAEQEKEKNLSPEQINAGKKARQQEKAEQAEAARAARAVFDALSEEDQQFALQGPRSIKLAPRVLGPRVAFLMNTMLRDVIRYGTGRRALVLQRKDLAGKTGTTNDQRDAWFSGFNRNVVTIAWVGFDNPRPLGDRETGARAALPMWIDFMRVALRDTPESGLEQPADIVSVRIDAESGELAGPNSPDTLFEYFRTEHVPTRQAEDIPLPDSPDAETPSGDITEELF